MFSVHASTLWTDLLYHHPDFLQNVKQARTQMLISLSFGYFVCHLSLPFMFALRFWPLTEGKIWRSWQWRSTFLTGWRMNSVGGVSMKGLHGYIFLQKYFFYRQLHIEVYLICLVTLGEQIKQIFIKLDEISKWIILTLYFQLLEHYAEKIMPWAIFANFGTVLQAIEFFLNICKGRWNVNIFLNCNMHHIQ